MPRLLICLGLLAILAGCAQPAPVVSVQKQNHEAALENLQDGSSIEKAVVIQEKTESEGIPAESAWLSNQYPGYKITSQTMIHKNEKSYDILHIRTKEGKEKDIYFDISSFFGNF